VLVLVLVLALFSRAINNSEYTRIQNVGLWKEGYSSIGLWGRGEVRWLFSVAAHVANLRRRGDGSGSLGHGVREEGLLLCFMLP